MDTGEWIHKISYRVNDAMTCYDVLEQTELHRHVAQGDTVEIYREWWANPVTRQIIDVRPVPAYAGTFVSPVR